MEGKFMQPNTPYFVISCTFVDYFRWVPTALDY